jgi:hypothetical protein
VMADQSLMQRSRHWVGVYRLEVKIWIVRMVGRSWMIVIEYRS